MSHAYYQYNKEQLLKEPRLPLICMPDNATVFQAMAKEMFEDACFYHCESGLHKEDQRGADQHPYCVYCGKFHNNIPPS